MPDKISFTDFGGKKKVRRIKKRRKKESGINKEKMLDDLLLSKKDSSYDAIIALGCVIKGETDHYHYISQAVTDGIMSLTIELENENPKIVFGVLTCQNRELAIARSDSNMDKNKGYEAGKAALKMISIDKN